MKKFSIITTIVGALTSITGVILTVIGAFPYILSIVTRIFAPSSSVGIIGGADGPTSIFITSTLLDIPAFLSLIILIIGLCVSVLGIIALIVGVVLLIVSKSKKK